jgi:hypothetical protein
MTRGNDEELHRPSIESGQMPLGSGASPPKQWRAGPHDQRCSACPGPVCSIRPALIRQPDSRLPPFRWVRRALAHGIVGLSAAILGIAPALADRNAAPKDAEAYIIWPSDGTVVEGGKLWVRMGLRNMGVSPKGVHMPNVGHHHLLIDTELGAMDEPIPSDRNHLHFGAGETEARIELPPGKHTLQLLLGDENHVPHDPPVFSKKITITVR